MYARVFHSSMACERELRAPKFVPMQRPDPKKPSPSVLPHQPHPEAWRIISEGRNNISGIEMLSASPAVKKSAS